jgi:hypothetical protein
MQTDAVARWFWAPYSLILAKPAFSGKSRELQQWEISDISNEPTRKLESDGIISTHGARPIHYAQSGKGCELFLQLEP